ncbi:MAG TPA: hypothetical protein VM240_02070 [Verrucomicrobiae bacterium]|nr:hypothetical protein [Verrucomicrobiae bacterium]
MSSHAGHGPARILLALLLVLAAPALAAAEMPRTEQQLEAMVQAGEAEAAYQSLKAHQRKYREEGWWQYLIARAALEARYTDEAVARLADYVTRNPMQDPARFHLAHAYEQDGQSEEAIEQYRHLLYSSAFEPTRERARTELARLGALPSIPVAEPQVEELPGKDKAPEFEPEEDALLYNAFLGSGYDDNAASSTDVERYVYVDRVAEQRDSASGYISGGASVLLSRASSENFAWRSAVGTSAQHNPDATFADTQSVAAQTQVRWSGPTQRFSLGAAYSIEYIDDMEVIDVTGAGARLDLMGSWLMTGVGVEGARVRYPNETLRDVNSMFMRVEVTRAPSEEHRWIWLYSIFTGHENELRADSPFGRAVWGTGLTVTRLISPTFNWDVSVDLSQSTYDEGFTVPEDREDIRTAAHAFLHWKRSEESRWTWSAGGRYTINSSNEPAYDFERTQIGIELAGVWGRKQK